ncbi:helix-turn-helix domain-containing protein [Streptomyces physcomitrii]|uniref:Helix-turn-helix transcriptional regulator n=1 Tax=Streptomyces physcomitrii TaxID=2724184 RepID=A0ABX1GV27_9ACTN|nr:helix-turn-helix transcriptional regulator [Streptomyces physcomitrii]NKI39928.1 helix-turn-helix transcriptional regulator [Streptomyces physcomitrii]
MPTRRTPTQRQRRLGTELRKLRTAADLTTDYAAGLLGMDRTRIANMESGIRSINAERVRTLASNYACGDDSLIDALVAMADNPERGWWERYRGTLPSGLLDIAELEWHARRILTVQTMHVPGLLHTEDYARCIFDAVLPPLPRLEVELRVQHRMERQQVISDPLSRPYVNYVHEAALRMQFGGRTVMRKQLEHVCAASEQSNVEVRVIPFEAGVFPGAGHALLYTEGSVPQLDTAQLDTAHGAEFVHAEAQLAKYRNHLAWMDEHCLSPDQSRELIYSAARQL